MKLFLQSTTDISLGNIVDKNLTGTIIISYHFIIFAMNFIANIAFLFTIHLTIKSKKQ